VEYYTDPRTGRQYFMDPDTGLTRWVEPPGDRTPAEATEARSQVLQRVRGPRTGAAVAIGGVSVLTALVILVVVMALASPQVDTVRSVDDTSTGSAGPATSTTSTTTGGAVVPAPTSTSAPSTSRSTTPPKPSSASTSRTTSNSSSCDPNYSGACVPIARDVDCAGGSGNGPAYVQGPVIVIGEDIYGLDGDDDGIGCEPW
jgi:hypothetical protein